LFKATNKNQLLNSRHLAAAGRQQSVGYELYAEDVNKTDTLHTFTRNCRSKASLSLSGPPHSVGLLWTSDRSDANIFTKQQTTLTKDRLPFSWWDSNPQSHQASSHRPTP